MDDDDLSLGVKNEGDRHAFADKSDINRSSELHTNEAEEQEDEDIDEDIDIESPEELPPNMRDRPDKLEGLEDD